jgi:hypothetical protein
MVKKSGRIHQRQFKTPVVEIARKQEGIKFGIPRNSILVSIGIASIVT